MYIHIHTHKYICIYIYIYIIIYIHILYYITSGGRFLPLGRHRKGTPEIGL